MPICSCPRPDALARPQGPTNFLNFKFVPARHQLAVVRQCRCLVCSTAFVAATPPFLAVPQVNLLGIGWTTWLSLRFSPKKAVKKSRKPPYTSHAHMLSHALDSCRLTGASRVFQVEGGMGQRTASKLNLLAADPPAETGCDHSRPFKANHQPFVDAPCACWMPSVSDGRRVRTPSLGTTVEANIKSAWCVAFLHSSEGFLWTTTTKTFSGWFGVGFCLNKFGFGSHRISRERSVEDFKDGRSA